MGAPAEEFGPYVVYEQIGLGGMATVHRAEAKGIAGFSKQVALKRMLPSVAADASLVKSFIREARLASHLRHANVAQTYDLGKVGETYFIAMELVPGRNLREILKHCAAVVGHMPLQIAMNIVNQICDALDYAHNLCDDSGQPLGIIHRDVSPSNIIVSEGGVVKLIDFGIAKASARGMNTMSGTIKGKFGYMAPEYLMGSIDARADLFALGVIAHELLSNRPLFQGKDDMDTLYRVKDMPIQPPSAANPRVPPELDAIIMTALERDPEARWQRAHALHAALTTETKRLGLVATNSSVVEWTEWAFQQRKGQFDEDSEPMISISGGTMEMPRGTPAERRLPPTPMARPSVRASPRDVVPDEFSSASDSLATVVTPAHAELRSGDVPDDDWNAGADSTTPASRSLDAKADPTKLIRPSAQLRAQVPDADPRSSERPSSRNIVRRNTPVPLRPDQARTVMVTPPSEPAPLPAVPIGGVPARPPQGPSMFDRPDRPSQQPPLGQASPPPLGQASPPPLGHAPPAPIARTLHGPGDFSNPGLVLPSSASVPVLDHLDVRAERPAAGQIVAAQAPTVVKTRVESGRRGGASNFLLAVLVLIAAGGAAAVVYFALPYLT